jgi:hypothetical protein
MPEYGPGVARVSIIKGLSYLEIDENLASAFRQLEIKTAGVIRR